MKKEKGFTLIELMIVVSIIGILAIVVINGVPQGGTHVVTQGEQRYVTRSYHLDDGCIEIYDHNVTLCGQFQVVTYEN